MSREEYSTTKPDKRDVLLGRGSGANEHPGNYTFRRMVDARQAEYNDANKRKVKCQIAHAIVDEIIADGGRFLKRKSEQEKHVWIPAGKAETFEKAKQALRQNPKKKETGSSTVANTNTPEKAPAREKPKKKASNSTDASPRRKKAPRISSPIEIQTDKETDAYAGLSRERLVSILKRKDATIDELLEQLKKKDATIASLSRK